MESIVPWRDESLTEDSRWIIVAESLRMRFGGGSGLSYAGGTLMSLRTSSAMSPRSECTKVKVNLRKWSNRRAFNWSFSKSHLVFLDEFENFRIKTRLHLASMIHLERQH